jgi:uncharacterized protein DUF2752
LLRLKAVQGGLPLGAVLAAIGILAGLAVGWLHLDHLPFSICVFKALTGWPCPTCGATRALGLLFRGDVPGAFRMSPLATLGAAGLLLWGLADLALLPRGRAFALELSPRLGPPARAAAVLILLGNWAYLIATGR